MVKSAGSSPRQVSYPAFEQLLEVLGLLALQLAVLLGRAAHAGIQLLCQDCRRPRLILHKTMKAMCAGREIQAHIPAFKQCWLCLCNVPRACWPCWRPDLPHAADGSWYNAVFWRGRMRIPNLRGLLALPEENLVREVSAPKLPGVQHDIRISYSSDTEASGHQLAVLFVVGHHTYLP